MIVPDPTIFWWIVAFVANAAAVNPNGIKMLLTNDLRTFFLKGNPAFSNGSKSLHENRPDWPILYNRVFNDVILAEELCVKGLRSLETCVLVNNNSCEKLFSLLESSTTFDENFKVS